VSAQIKSQATRQGQEGGVLWRWVLLRKSESFGLSSISLITATSRIDIFAGHNRLDVARCPRLRGGSAGESHSGPRRHRDGQGIASRIATAGAAELLPKIEQFGVPRSAVLQQRGGNVSPSLACRTARDDYMPWAQISEP